MLSLGDRIAIVRRTIAKATQEEFAERLRLIDPSLKTGSKLVSQWEKSHRKLNASARNAICKAFEVSREWLETGEGEMQTSHNLTSKNIKREYQSEDKTTNESSRIREMELAAARLEGRLEQAERDLKMVVGEVGEALRVYQSEKTQKEENKPEPNRQEASEGI